MTITAKLVVDKKFVQNITLSDDPGETELIKGMGGVPETDMVAHTFGTVGNWEVMYVGSQPKNRLVIGKMPRLSDATKKRVDCTLTDQQSEKLVDALEILWTEFGFKM
ncbi:hypothetical protein ELI15_14080 [Rhizobium ruizarguesonis]|uniref:hypothetical protein n=1 Tax=Rhizobium ruizarguesonis TaxID=2081791 RepID=UPI001031EC93|nr:hypothetical protein [Rhizobium ruizarguesonis]TAW65418.1 hypothetical protein ELI15_14080 [Rhizobium ruizarguesonis]